MLRRRGSVAVIAVLGTAAWLVAGSLAAGRDHGSEFWAGQWTTSTGGVAWRAFNEVDLEIAKKGTDATELFNKLPCKNGPRFYRGGYMAGDDRGKIMGCGTATHMRGRWMSNIGGIFQNGSYEIRISSRNPLKFTGTFRQDDGVGGTYSGTWSNHFGGDGCCPDVDPGQDPGGAAGSATTPAIGVGAPDPLPPLPPPPVEAVLVKIDGNGSVTSAPVRALSAAGGAPKRINCREGVYDCYTEVKPGQTLILTATPQPGYAFQGWTGACAGVGATCQVVASDARTVTARFAASGAGAAVGAALRPPRLKVRWVRSLGVGTLVIQGSTTVAAQARIDVRRPGGGPLATLQTPLGGGGFRQVLALQQGSLARGAKVFPGGFVVALTGRAAKFKLPLQVQTISIPAPPEGVVRQAFRSARQEGRNVPRFPAGVREVWANFRFETQPALNRRLTVRWYRPNGSVLGNVQKSNRPVVSSYMRAAPGIATGVWRAELRTGGKVVSTLSVRIG